MTYHADHLGPGFEQLRFERAPDKYSPRSATLIRYSPQADPRCTWPDRVVPGNLQPGGAPPSDTITVLPPAASPQQADELQGYYQLLGITPPEERQTQAQLTDSQQRDTALLLDFWHRELRGRQLQLSEELPTPPSPSFILLYLHGWNDYFYHPHLARLMSHLGAAFYALELHRYGRNMPDWEGLIHYNCYTEDFFDYDPEINWALAQAQSENPGLPVIIMGHSNGGGVVSSWVGRNHSKVQGMILNSPWIVQDVSQIPSGEKVLELIRNHARGIRLPFPQAQLSTYADSLQGYRAADSALPQRLVPFLNDPSVKGWKTHPQWRMLSGAPTLFAWVSAVLRNHQWLLEHSEYGNLPVLCLTGRHQLDPRWESEVQRVDRLTQKLWKKRGNTLPKRCLRLATNSWESRREISSERKNTRLEPPFYQPILLGWTEASRHIDTVLNGDLIVERAQELFPSNAVIKQLSGYHDLALSQPLERLDYFSEISAWLHGLGLHKE